jgi:Ricin-type beta-trefoil lectin domain-like
MDMQRQNDRSMVWYVELGDFPDAYKIKNFNSDLCLDVRSGSHDDYVQLQQYHCTSNNAAQNFWQTEALPFTNTVLDLNGNWTDGSTRSARIYQGPVSKFIKIDMSAFGRPNANGSIVDFSTITVTFPDDRKYTGQLQFPSTIRWSNGSVWTRKP